MADETNQSGSVLGPCYRITESELRENIRVRVAGFDSLRKAAKAFGIAPSHLSKYLRGEFNAGPAILRIGGVRREVRYYQRVGDPTDG